MVRDWTEEQAINNSQIDPRTGGRKATWWDKTVTGAFGGDAQGAVDDAVATGKTKKAEDLLTASGHSRQTLGLPDGPLTSEQVSGAIRTYRDNKEDNSPQTKAILSSIQTNKGQLELQGQQLEQRGKEAQQRMNLLLEQTKNSNDIARLTLEQNRDFRTMDKADKKSERAMMLEIEQMRGAREDKRLEQQHKMYYDDKRQAGIQSLVAGLAALGAAFAL